ncbi:hypothetical protein [Solwaraspora sp. WMMD792]|nr:hypothetical protein [Solwaraspora sp. WMMD792]MDG4770560.1 hypothetical protein [Solwaraspora sp. WMMD792]
MVSIRRTLAGTTVAGTMVDNELWTPWRCERTVFGTSVYWFS